jgi:predicted nucleotidyltransferase
MIKKDIKTKIKEFFLEHPSSKMRVREIERELKLPLPSVIRYTKELAEEGILKKANVSNITYFTANAADERYVLEKKLFNIRRLYDSGLIKFIKEEYSNPAIILFGSCAKGEDTEKSDIDLYVEAKVGNLEEYEKKLNKKIQLFCHKNIHEIKNKELANNILNGTVLSGFLEVLK